MFILKAIQEQQQIIEMKKEIELLKEQNKLLMQLLKKVSFFFYIRYQRRTRAFEKKEGADEVIEKNAFKKIIFKKANI